MNKILYWMVCFMLVTSVSAHAMEFSVTPFYWFPDLDASADIEKRNIGNKVDFVSDLGMDDDEGIPGGIVDIKLGRSNHFMFSYWSVGYDENGHQLTQDISYNGLVYSSGTRVNSSFDLDTIEAGYAFDLINFETFNLGFLLNVIWYAVDTEINQVSPTLIMNDDKVDVIFPSVGIRSAIGFWENKLELSGQFAGLWWQGSGWWDGSAAITFYPMKNLGISGGYRAIHVDASDDDDAYNIKLDGFNASVTYRF